MTIREQNVWSLQVSARQARAVGRALREAGYQITNGQVRELGYALNIGNYLEPGQDRTDMRSNVFRLVCEAAGFQPRHVEA